MPQNFEIRVISLKNQLDRREKINNLFDNKNIRWSFSDAISGKDIQPFLRMYDRKKRLQTPGYDLRDNEIACFLSHREIWKECAQKNKNFLILEDDIKINSNTSLDLIDSTNKIIEKVKKNHLFVRLGNLFKRDFFELGEISTGLHLVRYKRDPSTTMGYILSPNIASKLVLHSENFFTAVDDFLWRGWEHQCCLLDVYPNILFTSDIETPSAIGDRSKPKLTIIKKIKREYFRALDTKKRSNYEKSIILKLRKNENSPLNL